MALAAEMMQKATNTAGMILSSIMTLSMPSKTCLTARYELRSLATTTMTNDDHSNSEHNNNNNNNNNNSSRWPTPCAYLNQSSRRLPQAAESTDSAVSTTSRATLLPSGVMHLCKSNSIEPMVSAIAPIAVQKIIGMLARYSFPLFCWHHMGDVCGEPTLAQVSKHKSR
jgi:hypothetical protein